MKVRIERLESRHRRDGFDSGEPALDAFLTRLAGQQQRRGFGKTYVALADDGLEVTGFVTVSAGQVATTVLPAPPNLPRHAAPILRIGRLAVDRRHQGKGIGQALLSFALHLALDFSERVGLYAVVVDAKNENVARYYRQIGFEPTLDDPLCLFLPISTLAKTRDG